MRIELWVDGKKVEAARVDVVVNGCYHLTFEDGDVTAHFKRVVDGNVLDDRYLGAGDIRSLIVHDR